MKPLWRPTADQVASTQMDRFRRQHGCKDYGELHRWSVDDREGFWRAAWQFCNVIGTPGEALCERLDAMPGTRWFPEAQLSFAENLLARTDEATAVIYRDEGGTQTSITFAQLSGQVAALAAHLQKIGIVAGDRIAAILPNRIEAIVCMLATASLGAVFSSCSPDFGTRAIIDRFGQISPRVLIGCNAYRYNGRRFSCLTRLSEVAGAIAAVEAVIVVRTDNEADTETPDRRNLDFADCIAGDNTRHTYVRRCFDKPLYIMFSSGTTGVPKCIVHGQGGTLLKHRVEHVLHCDLRPDERLLFFTTCGWMMWNWLVSALANGTTVCLYEGSAFHPDPGSLWRFIEEAGINHVGISPGLISALAKSDYRPASRHDLRSVSSLLSTGSPLPASSHRWAYDHIAKVRLSSITGGTDIIGCFALGNPCTAVYAGEIQSPGLGMDIAFLDDNGKVLPQGKGELVCRRSFVSMPIGFWNDADGSRYAAAYFERFEGTWHHGDFGQFTDNDGVMIHGRSDAVLNRGGVRVGTAEIYRQVERVAEVLESIAVGRERGDDLQLVLFVRLREGVALTDALINRIGSEIRSGASPRHVPDRIVAVADIPRTRSGKLTEIAVRDVLNGRAVANAGALANPEALDLFRNLRLD